MASGNLKSVTDGLLVSIDTNNLKSYVGPPLQNLLTNIGITSGTGTGYVFTSSTTTDYIPNIQLSTTVSNCFAQNTGASWCCPNLFSYGDITGANVTGSTLYTYMLLYYSQSGYTHPNYLYRYEYNSGTYVTESGIFSDANRIDLGSGWYWAWGTFTTQATTNRLILYSFYYRYSSFSDRVAIARAALFKGNYTALPPLEWPPVNTTRTATNCLFNLNGGNSYDITNMTVNSAGDMSFAASSSNYIPLGTGFANFTTGITGEFWASFTSTSYTWERLMDFGTGQAANNIIFCRYANTNNLFLELYGSGSSLVSFQATNAITNGSVAHYAFTMNGTTAVVYKNGIPHTSTTTSQLPTNVTRTNCWIGRSNWAGDSYFQGNIPIINLYNRALTPSEILQNYNATKSRFRL
jgi:hypothetical protein